LDTRVGVFMPRPPLRSWAPHASHSATVIRGAAWSSGGWSAAGTSALPLAPPRSLGGEREGEGGRHMRPAIPPQQDREGAVGTSGAHWRKRPGTTRSKMWGSGLTAQWRPSGLRACQVLLSTEKSSKVTCLHGTQTVPFATEVFWPQHGSEFRANNLNRRR
jgi:hypothetical protein